MTSVKRGKRHLVAVVLGGRSGGARDARMRELIEAHVNEGAINRTAPRVVEAPEVADRRLPRRVRRRVSKRAWRRRKRRVFPLPPRLLPAKETAPQKQDTAKTETVTTAAIPPARPSPAPGSTDPIKPNMVKTLTVKASASQTASLAPVSLLSPMPVTSQTHAALGARSEPELPPPPPGASPGVLGVLSTQAVAAPAPVAPTPAPAAAAPVQKPVPVYASAAAPAACRQRAAARPRRGSSRRRAGGPAPAPVNISSEIEAPQRLDRAGRRL